MIPEQNNLDADSAEPFVERKCVIRPVDDPDDEKPLWIRIYKPVREEVKADAAVVADTPFATHVRLECDHFTKTFRTFGEDGLQSLIHALRIIVVELEVAARDHNWEIFWLTPGDLEERNLWTPQPFACAAPPPEA